MQDILKAVRIHRVIGWIGVILGALGITLCFVAFVGVLWLNGVITTQVLRIFPPIEIILTFGDQAAIQFETIVDSTQTQFNTVVDAQPVATVLADELSKARLLVDTASRLFESLDDLLSQFARTERLTITLDDVITALNSTEALAQQLRDGRTDTIDAINSELDTLKARSVALQTAIDEISNDVAHVKTHVPHWINLVSFVITLLLLWFGIAQYNLSYNSWGVAHRIRSTDT